jgi:hypothetical protein
MFAPVATGCCYRLRGHRTSSLGANASRSRPRNGTPGGIRIRDALIRDPLPVARVEGDRFVRGRQLPERTPSSASGMSLVPARAATG